MYGPIVGEGGRVNREALGRVLRRIAEDPRRRELGLYAADGACHLLLSLGPLTALLLAVLPYTPVTEAQLTEEVLSVAPSAFRQLLRIAAADAYARSGAALGPALVLELWSGARFLAAVVRGIAGAGGRGVGYLRRRLLGAAFTAALLALLLGALSLMWFGGRLLAAAAVRWPGRWWRAAALLRPAVLLLGVTGVNVLLFRWGGGTGRRLPGAALSAALWLGFSRGWSWALGRFGGAGVYGGIAAVTVSLGWAYGSLYILFLGAWLNSMISVNCN